MPACGIPVPVSPIPTLALGSRNKPANERHVKRDEVMLSTALRAKLLSTLKPGEILLGVRERNLFRVLDISYVRLPY